MFRLIAREIKGAWDQVSPVHVAKFPAYLGHTVYQSEYDALKEECNRAHELNVQLQNKVNVLEGAIAEDLLTIDTLQKQLEETELLRKNAFEAYDQQVEKNTALRRELEGANNTIEKLSIENDVLTKAAAKRKPKPRETGVRP